MSKFVAGFIDRLQGKISDEDLTIVGNELEEYVLKWQEENNCYAIQCPEDYIPREYKEYIVTLKLEGKTKGTISAYNATMVPFFMAMQTDLQSISSQKVKLYLIQYADTCHGKCKTKPGPHTLETMRREMNAFFVWCQNNGYLSVNPVNSIKAIKYTVKPIDVLTPIELSKLRNACKTKRELAVINCLYSTAARVSELISIKRQDIRWRDANKNGVVPIDITGKGGKRGVVYLDANANVSLRAYLDNRDDDNEYVFVNEKKPYGQMTARSVQIMVQNIGKRAGVDHVHPHEFRHTRATDFVRASGSILLTSKMLRHSNIQTTQKYYVATDQDELEYEISKYC